tara:strand:- start:787 stop:1332 length:546 start_codon:yes stop_codon:yes gene_type:complete
MLTPRFNPPKAWMGDYNHYVYGFADMMMKLTRMGIRGKALEIGSYTGDTAALMGMFGIFDEIHCVEPFEGHEEFLDGGSWIEVEKKFHSQTRNYPVALHKGFSYDILPTLNEQFDFIYIDGAHDYESVRQDIQLSLPLLKKGGVIAGHDYQREHRGVVRAVGEAFGQPTHRFQDDSWMVHR